MNVHYNQNQSSQFVKKQKRKLLYLAAYGVDYTASEMQRIWDLDLVNR